MLLIKASKENIDTIKFSSIKLKIVSGIGGLINNLDGKSLIVLTKESMRENNRIVENSKLIKLIHETWNKKIIYVCDEPDIISCMLKKLNQIVIEDDIKNPKINLDYILMKKRNSKSNKIKSEKRIAKELMDLIKNGRHQEALDKLTDVEQLTDFIVNIDNMLKSTSKIDKSNMVSLGEYTKLEDEYKMLKIQLNKMEDNRDIIYDKYLSLISKLYNSFDMSQYTEYRNGINITKELNYPLLYFKEYSTLEGLQNFIEDVKSSLNKINIKCKVLYIEKENNYFIDCLYDECTIIKHKEPLSTENNSYLLHGYKSNILNFFIRNEFDSDALIIVDRSSLPIDIVKGSNSIKLNIVSSEEHIEKLNLNNNSTISGDIKSKLNISNSENTSIVIRSILKLIEEMF